MLSHPQSTVADTNLASSQTDTPARKLLGPTLTLLLSKPMTFHVTSATITPANAQDTRVREKNNEKTISGIRMPCQSSQLKDLADYAQAL